MSLFDKVTRLTTAFNRLFRDTVTFCSAIIELRNWLDYFLNHIPLFNARTTPPTEKALHLRYEDYCSNQANNIPNQEEDEREFYETEFAACRESDRNDAKAQLIALQTIEQIADKAAVNAVAQGNRCRTAREKERFDISAEAIEAVADDAERCWGNNEFHI